MTRPIFFGTETDIAVLILALKVIAKGIPTSFGLLLIEAAARKDTTNGFNPHHCSTGPTIHDRRSAFEASLDPWSM